MKPFWCAAFLFLLLLSPAVWAESADDQYVGIYNTIQQADALAESGQWASALEKYSGAESDLKRFQGIYPDWNLNIVSYRLKYLAGKIAMVSAKIPQPAPVREEPTIAPPTEAQAKPPVEIPTPPAPITPAVVVPPPPSSSDILIGQLQEQLRQVNEANREMNAANELLNAKLREALSARPAAVDPAEFARSQDEVRELQKRNEVLLASLDQTKAKLAEAGIAASSDLRRELADTQNRLAEVKEANTELMVEKGKLETQVKELAVPDAATIALREENDVLKKQVADLKNRRDTAPDTESARRLIEAQAQLAVLESDKEILRLENTALNDRVKQVSTGSPVTMVAPPLDAATVEKIKRLEAERDGLQKRLDAAMVDIAASKPTKSGAAARADETSQQLAGLRARIDILEARPVPYTAEELALMSKPAETMLVAVAHRSGRKLPSELPAKATALLADAKRDVANDQLDKAEAKYLEILRMDEKNTATLADLASIQVDLEHTAEAEKNITAALAVEPNNEYSLFVLGRVRFQQNRFDDAFEALSRAAQMNPDNAEIQNYLGITLSEKGLRVQAEAALRRAVQIDPGNASAHANLAFVYITQQPPLVELARLHYEKALAAGHPHNPAIEKLLDPAKNAPPVNP